MLGQQLSKNSASLSKKTKAHKFIFCNWRLLRYEALFWF